MKTYAVSWREPDGRTFIGRLALGPLTLGFDGCRRGADEPPVSRQFGYGDLSDPGLGRLGAERLDGRPALVIERPEGAYLVGDAGLGAPILQELVEQLFEHRLRSHENCGKSAIGLRSAPDGRAWNRHYVDSTSKGRKGGTT